MLGRGDISFYKLQPRPYKAISSNASVEEKAVYQNEDKREAAPQLLIQHNASSCLQGKVNMAELLKPTNCIYA
ncbi:hypothetical protein EJB05_15738, partial [Eragrostis curvula]